MCGLPEGKVARAEQAGYRRRRRSGQVGPAVLRQRHLASGKEIRCGVEMNAEHAVLEDRDGDTGQVGQQDVERGREAPLGIDDAMIIEPGRVSVERLGAGDLLEHGVDPPFSA